MLKKFFDYFELDDFIKFEAFKKLTLFIIFEYAIFAIIMLAW